MFLKRAHFPFLNKFVKGCNLIAQSKFGKKVNVPKFAIVNPQLEAMLKIAKNRNVRMAMLFQHRFVLRAEHYCYTHEDKQWLRVKNILFYPDIQQPTQVTIYTTQDKNHQFSTHNQRTCVCTCKTEWSCVVHELANYLLPRWIYKTRAVIQVDYKVIKYDFMLSAIKAIIKELKLDPTNYGTHSFRAGGATELHCEGHDVVHIQQFGHWKSLDSANGYIRPWNADLYQFVKNWELYCQKRRAQNPYGLGVKNVLITRKIHRNATV